MAHAAIMAEVPVDLGYLFRVEDPNEQLFVFTVIDRVTETRRAAAAEQKRRAAR